MPQPGAGGALPTPAGFRTIAEDHAVILEWNGGDSDLNLNFQQPASIAGYQVKWWPIGDAGNIETRITQYHRIEIQSTDNGSRPLENDRRYLATVAAIGQDGSLSSPSAPIEVVTSSARIDAMRTRMNAFFDDFNLPAGIPDELKWDTAFSICNDPIYSGFFINSQLHVHSNHSTLNGFCGIGQTNSRARKLLDLSDGGTRTITFDFDGHFGRDFMYIELAPQQPTFSYQGSTWRQGKALRFFSGNDTPRTFRIGTSGQSVYLQYVEMDGEETTLDLQDAGWSGAYLIQNVRRRWEIRISTTKAEVYIDGNLIVASPSGSFTLPATKYAVVWEAYGYNGPKANHLASLHHWDNFGFDGPAQSGPEIVTHNYRINNGGTDRVDAAGWNSTTARTQLKIPDSIVGATERRFIFTNNGFAWDARDKVIINGRSFPIPDPRTAIVPAITHWNDWITPYTYELTLPDGVLKTGVNDIVFQMDKGAVNNIHAEFDFTKGSEPSFTVPALVANGSGMPPVMPVGPFVSIATIGGQQTWLSPNNRFDPNAPPAPQNTQLSASGTVDIEISADNEGTLSASGSAVGIVEIGIIVDGQVVARRSTNKTVAPPTVNVIIPWDTTQVPDGYHEVQEYACNANHIASVMSEENGGYRPLYVRVNNHGGSSQIFQPAQTPDIVGLCNPTVQSVDLGHNH